MVMEVATPHKRPRCVSMKTAPAPAPAPAAERRKRCRTLSDDKAAVRVGPSLPFVDEFSCDDAVESIEAHLQRLAEERQETIDKRRYSASF
ncbi:hypothetical protein P43SY_000627 [Pythium insidiosum]|uniref:Uncharacterized protein n=1 Tax=Pythium insidiosum TaxID=114742 RepID=A0AAD5LAF9_PYTIN|nr:hypothetical protein P43SY_000627 [Pythium insidiosum]KAJ0395371.1 hypothetical protein ATCC90586_008663 [Pythium insidiosum]